MNNNINPLDVHPIQQSPEVIIIDDDDDDDEHRKDSDISPELLNAKKEFDDLMQHDPVFREGMLANKIVITKPCIIAIKQHQVFQTPIILCPSHSQQQQTIPEPLMKDISEEFNRMKLRKPSKFHRYHSYKHPFHKQRFFRNKFF